MLSVMDLFRIVLLVGGLLDLLDKFNWFVFGVQKEDEEDLVWLGGIGSFILVWWKVDGDVIFIRLEDLDNYNKDGGFWVVIYGKVYDF